MVQIQNDILVIFWKVQQSPPICFIFTFIVGKCPLQWISIGPMSRARCPWKYRSQSKYSAVEHRNQQEVEKVPKQTERREYWFQKKYIFPSVIAIASTWWFSSCYCKIKPTNISWNSQMATIYYTLNAEKQKSLFADKLFLQLSLSPLFLLSIALHPEFPTAFSDNPCNLSWLSFICILNAHRCLFSEAFPPSAQNSIYPIEPPVSFTCTCFMQGRPSHPRLLRPWDLKILLPKYSYTLRILSEWDLIP